MPWSTFAALPAAVSALSPEDAERLSNVSPAGWRSPKPLPVYHLLVIGAVPAGLVAARAAAALGAHVALIERHQLGGDCLNDGCIPSKSLIRTGRLLADMRNAVNFSAVPPAEMAFDFRAAMLRMRRITARISRTDSAMNLAREGIHLFFRTARFTEVNAVDVGGVTMRFKKALIATGSRSMLPDIPGLAEAGFLTNETVFDLQIAAQEPACDRRRAAGV